MAVRDRPLLTDIYATPNDFTPEAGSAYISCASGEDRCRHSSDLEARGNGIDFVRVTAQTATDFEVEIGSTVKRIPLRSGRQLQELCTNVGTDRIYIDITGLANHTWAPLFRAALLTGREIKAVYVEPAEYRVSTTPTEGEIFDLSERINGIAPIPGFASLTVTDDDNTCFIPLLGFEGTRLKYLIEQVQPSKIAPIVGVPGFRPEYGFHAYLGNQLPLVDNGAWRNVRFAIANCPFSLFNALEDIAEVYPQDLLKIAPIGTKPHALGAILYSLINPRPVEIVYDHPIRKVGGTAGAARLLVYHVSALSVSSTRK